ncbi:hypothetical protein [Enterococcus sp. AZ058]|uniref:hypothetical protein n=1 Tax=unclassified Enterococcus TaxID=2608891 RepID=UPI003D26EFC4
MDSLYCQLIFHAKAERWFQLLEIMEENKHILAQHLIDQTQAARRTVFDDIKEIKIYFGDTLQLTGKEDESNDRRRSSVRQFLYDFCFTLPLYPEILPDHIGHLRSEKLVVPQGTWRLDHQLLNQ